MNTEVRLTDPVSVAILRMSKVTRKQNSQSDNENGDFTKWFAFASLRGMSVTEVMDFIKYILLVLMIYI